MGEQAIVKIQRAWRKKLSHKECEAPKKIEQKSTFPIEKKLARKKEKEAEQRNNYDEDKIKKIQRLFRKKK